MAVTGRKPKPVGEARHRNKARYDWTEVLDVPYEGLTPTLPRRRGGWPTQAKRKWAVWSRMPHCVLWTEADWQFAIDTLEVAARFYEGESTRAPELRTREKVLGTTVDYRRDLRIRYVNSETTQEQQSDDVPNINDYRDRLG